MRRVRSFTRPVARRLADERGIAMIAAMSAMLILALLASAAVAVALQGNGFSRRDLRQKNALEAAEAGLQVALYRINMLQPSDANCVGDAVAAPGPTGWCQSTEATLGNGSTYRFFTTPVEGPGDACVGATVDNAVGVSNRCITAVGTASGVTARSQIRAAAFAAQPLFPVDGISGTNGITDGENGLINGWEASNLGITVQNNTIITGGIELGPRGTYTYANGASNPPEDRLTSTLVLDPVATGDTHENNDDYRIANALKTPAGTPADGVSGNVGYDASTRSLTLGNKASLTLTGSVYNFCSLTAANNAQINLTTGQSVVIIIDAPDQYDPGSGCPAGSGTLNAKNNWTSLTGDPTNLQILVYGTAPGQNTVTFQNNGTFTGVLYAPNSNIELGNNGVFNGAISGYHVDVPNNFQFNWSPDASKLEANPEGLYYRTAWAQCSSTWSTGAPGAHCG